MSRRTMGIARPAGAPLLQTRLDLIIGISRRLAPRSREAVLDGSRDVWHYFIITDRCPQGPAYGGSRLLDHVIRRPGLLLF